MHPLEKTGLTVLLLATLIFVHELGHFLMAKLFNVKVLKFSLGFGPKLLGFTWGETEYRISALPLGGYVKMAGDDPSDIATEAEQGRTFLEQPPWKRAAIGLAGPAMNLAFPILVYFVAFYFQHTALSSRLGRVEPDRPAYAAGLRAGDRITAVDGEPVRYFTELKDLIGPRWEREVKVTFERAGKTQTVTLVPERQEESNLLETEVRGVIGVAPLANAPVLGITDAASPAARAGLHTFDRVVSIDGAKVDTYADLALKLEAATAPLQLTVIRDELAGGGAGALTSYRTFEVTLTPEAREGGPYTGIESNELYVFSVEPGSPAWEAGLRRGDRLLEADGRPLAGWASIERVRRTVNEKPFTVAFLHGGERREGTVAQKKTVRYDEFGNGTELILFGASRDLRMTSYLEGEKIAVDISVGQALARAFRVVPDEIRKIGIVLARLVTGQLSFNNVGGVIMMYDIAGKSAEAGWEYFLQVMALISINLGVMNLLPIPVLDGFHILSAGVEAVRRRPISMRARAVANYIGLALLLTLMAFVFKNDIVRYILN